MDETKKYSVLVVDDENSNIMALTHILNPEYVVYAAKNGEKAIAAAEKHLPDVILLDIIMPEMDGYAALAALKKSEQAHNIPVIFITGLSNIADEEKGLALGAADYISKPFSPVIVKLRVQNQIKILEQFRIIERLSTLDQLTSIPNRRGFDIRMNMEWCRAIREQTPLSILIMDVDKFKTYNDTHGHQQGDVVLRAVAKVVTESISRASDFAARWGGEEFIVLLPNADLDGALHVAELIRISIGNEIIPCLGGTETKVTVSVGVNALTPKPGSSCDEFLSGADKALYKAKESGRNRICVATD